jgi:GNAT superfamily N-acetyltransferase
MAAAGEMALWSRVVVQGFEEREEVNPELVAMMAATCSGGFCFFGLDAGEPSAGAGMGIRDRTACLYGDSTLVRSRGRGLHSALIASRLAHARDLGCDLAMASVLPGSTSHRNYERAGFQLVYMRVNVARKWN